MLRHFLLAAVFVGSVLNLASTSVVTCYHGTWANYRPGRGQFVIEDIDPFLCTHVIYTFVGLNDNDGTVKLLDLWLDQDLGALNRFTGLKKQNPNLKTLIAIGGWNEGSAKYSKVAGDKTKRANLVESALNLVLTHGFDGFDIDWEYPNQGGERGGVPADVQNFVTLIKEFRAAFDPHNLILTAAVGATENRGEISYDIPNLSKYLDYIHIMTYDFHGAFDDPKRIGHNSPLYASSADTTDELRQANVNASISYWLSKGADPQKLVLGLGFYGRSYQLSSSSNTVIGAAFVGGGNSGPFTSESGYLGYNEICENLQEGGWTVEWDDEQKVPHAYKGNQWVGYDDPKSISVKVEFARSLNLAGVMLWSIETDDFKGACGEKYPLLNAIKSTLAGGSSENLPLPDEVPQTTRSTTTTKAATAKATTTKAPTTKATTTQTTKAAAPAAVDPSNVCSHAGFVRDPTNCSAYYYCLEDGNNLIPIKMPDCNEGLQFNEAAMSCDWPANVQC